MGRLLRVTRKAGFSLIEQENSDFITGSEREVRLASKLPYWLVSGWYFAFHYEGGDHSAAAMAVEVVDNTQ